MVQNAFEDNHGIANNICSKKFQARKRNGLGSPSRALPEGPCQTERCTIAKKGECSGLFPRRGVIASRYLQAGDGFRMWEG